MPTRGPGNGVPSSSALRLALIARHGMDPALTQVYPEARVMAEAEAGVVLHADRSGFEHCQHRFTTWLAAIGRTLNVTNMHLRHPWDGDPPGMDVVGFHIRPDRGGPHHPGKAPEILCP